MGTATWHLGDAPGPGFRHSLRAILIWTFHPTRGGLVDTKRRGLNCGNGSCPVTVESLPRHRLTAPCLSPTQPRA